MYPDYRSQIRDLVKLHNKLCDTDLFTIKEMDYSGYEETSERVFVIHVTYKRAPLPALEEEYAQLAEKLREDLENSVPNLVGTRVEAEVSEREAGDDDEEE